MSLFLICNLKKANIMAYKNYGTYLCGQVKILVVLQDINLSACHCYMCHKWIAGPLMALTYSGELDVYGLELIQHYNSSTRVESAFCKLCGSHLYYRLKGTKDYYIAAWLFDNIDKMVFTDEVYIDKKPLCYEFANVTHKITEAEILEMVAEHLPNK